jgi:hypothetical protein
VHDSNEIVNSTDKAGTKSQCCGRRLRNWELVKPLVDLPPTIPGSDAKFMKEGAALRLDCIKDDGVRHATISRLRAASTSNWRNLWSLHHTVQRCHTYAYGSSSDVHSSSPSLEGVAGYSHRRTPRHDSSRYSGTGLNL